MAAIRYSIRLGRNDLFVGPKIKEGYAKMRLRNKKDVWSTSKDKAMKIARKQDMEILQEDMIKSIII